MKVIKQIIRCLSLFEDILLLFVFLIFLITGIYAIYDNFLLYQSAGNSSISSDKSGGDDRENEKSIVGYMAARLTIDGTNIDYPIMQGETNIEYLNKDPYGEYSLSGSIFLDSRNDGKFEDDYSIVYGHHMENGYMFGALDDFLDEDYLAKHSSGTLRISEDLIYKIKIFAVLIDDATCDYFFAPGSRSNEEIIEHIKEKALILTKDVNDADKIIALSTCRQAGSNRRTIVIGSLYV